MATNGAKTKYETTDDLGNQYVILVTDDGRVLARNGHGIRVSLCSFTHTMEVAKAAPEIRKAAKAGLAALNRASFHNWTRA